MTKIDAHHHLWKYSLEEYGWIGETDKAIRRDFLPTDLEREIGAVGIDGVVTVQARQTLEETKWLLSLAERNKFMRGVVGWAPIIDPKLPDILEPLMSHPKLRSLRHVLQGEADENYILHEDFNVGMRTIEHFGLAYDILIYERHLPQTITFVDRLPNQIFILDHIAKPKIKDRVISPWRENITELAKRHNVYCKISGMVTEADYHSWTEADLQPYLDTVFHAFGPRRLMFGSDWPVCLVATTYHAWFDLVSRRLAKFSGPERDRVLGGTAVEAYKLDEAAGRAS